MKQYEFFLCSALEKVFPSRRPQAMRPGTELSGWRGGKAAVQLVYTVQGCPPGGQDHPYRIEIAGAPGKTRLRKVELVPSELPCFADADEFYITKEPGLFPDLLSEMEEPVVRPVQRQYRSVWMSFEIPADAQPGCYDITVRALPCSGIRRPNGEIIHDPEAEEQRFELSFRLKVGRAELPAQELLHTEWFHTDCLARYYGVSPFSGEYWRITENFIRSAGEHGINMLLTPVFTPPLDTPVGGERMTIQLVDVYREGGIYRFGFEKLERWAELCRKYGITCLEMPHLFTQWGASATPKIVAVTDGVEKRIFGWDVPAGSEEYRAFLEAFLPALRRKLAQLGYDDGHVYYHISDEPSVKHMDAYRTALRQTSGLLDGCRVLDALSDLEFYQHGLVQTPVCANDHIQPFFGAGVPNLWVYYCCAQGNLVPNRFFAMDSARNRIMGVLMYLYEIQGFLQWGFNYYNAECSKYPIDPYRTTDGALAYPSGDPFLVYPGPDGQPLSSVRAEVQDDALLDLRALRLLERLAGRAYTRKLICDLAGMETITFLDYPRDAGFLLSLRETVAAEIDRRS